MPKSYWGEVVLTVANLINRMPFRVQDHWSPMIVLLQFFTNFNGFNLLPLEVFECISYVHIYDQNSSKLDPRALKCIFIGYSLQQRKGTNAITYLLEHSSHLWRLIEVVCPQDYVSPHVGLCDCTQGRVGVRVHDIHCGSKLQLLGKLIYKGEGWFFFFFFYLNNAFFSGKWSVGFWNNSSVDKVH